MKFCSRGYISSSLIIIFTLMQNCASLSTFQSVEALEPGEKVWGMGITGGIVSDPYTEKGKIIIDMYSRFNLKKNWDMGLKISGMPPLAGVYAADVKYQVLSHPFYISGDLGLSFSHLFKRDQDDVSIYGLHQMIMAGTKRVYCGVKFVSLVSTGSVELYGSPFYLTNSIIYSGLFIGCNIGSKIKFMPEFHLYFPNESDAEPLKLWGIGVQYAISH